MQNTNNDLLGIIKLAGLKEQTMMQVTPPGTPKPPAMQPQLNLPPVQTQVAPTALGGAVAAVPGSNVKQPGQMEEELHGKQYKLDVDKDGDIEADDLADLRAGKVDEPDVEEELDEGWKEKAAAAGTAAAIGLGSLGAAQAAPDTTQSNATMTQHITHRYEMQKTADALAKVNPKFAKEYDQLKADKAIRDRAGSMRVGLGKTRLSPADDVFQQGDYEYTQVLQQLLKKYGAVKESNDGGETYPLKEEQLEECGDMGPMANGMADKQESRMNVSTNMSSDGTKTVTVTADGEAAEELMQLLSLAGMEHHHHEPEAEVVMYEEKDIRYEASTTPDEKVLPLDTQLQGGTGEVAGKTKKMTPRGYRHADNNLAMKENQVNESKTLSFLKEYESLLLKKKISESDNPRAQDRFGLELGDLLIETNVIGVTKDAVILETDQWAYDHLNKLGYISKEELTESTMIFEGKETVTIEDSETGEPIDVVIVYSTTDGSIDFEEVEVVGQPNKQLDELELEQAEKELYDVLKRKADDVDYYPDHDDHIDRRQRDYYSNFPMHYAGIKDTMEAKYQGREVPLGKPMAGDVKKSKVYVKGPKGNVVKVNFGDPNMRIKKSNPKRRKSFRARHHCANPGPRWKARYWSCRAW